MKRGFSRLWARILSQLKRSPQPTRVDRSPRIAPSAGHRVKIAVLSSSGWKALAICNLSTTGVGVQDVLRDFAIGQQIRVRVTLADRSFEMSAEVVRRHRGILGIRMLDPDPQYQATLTGLFRTEIEAVRMIQVPSHLLKEPELGEPVWFRGSDQTELYLNTLADRIETFQLSFFGHFLEGDSEGVRYGLLSAGDSSPARVKEADLIHWEASIDPPVADAILSFVQNINGLAESLKAELAARLKELPRADAPRNLRAGAIG